MIELKVTSVMVPICHTTVIGKSAGKLERHSGVDATLQKQMHGGRSHKME